MGLWQLQAWHHSRIMIVKIILKSTTTRTGNTEATAKKQITLDCLEQDKLQSKAWLIIIK